MFHDICLLVMCHVLVVTEDIVALAIYVALKQCYTWRLVRRVMHRTFANWRSSIGLFSFQLVVGVLRVFRQEDLGIAQRDLSEASYGGSDC